jgi:hypothetical protein
MTDWKTEAPSISTGWKALPVGGVMKMSKARIAKIMQDNPGQFAWSEPDLLKRIAPADVGGDRIMSTIYRSPEGITLGVLINRFRHLPPEAVTEAAAKLEAGGLVRSVSSVHKYNKRQTVTYYPA